MKNNNDKKNKLYYIKLIISTTILHRIITVDSLQLLYVI